MGILGTIGSGFKDAGKAVGGKIKDVGGGIKDAGKWAYENIDELDDTLRLKQIAQIGQFIPGPQQPFVKGLAMVYAGSDAFKATSEGNPLGVLSAGLQLSGSSKIDTGGMGPWGTLPSGLEGPSFGQALKSNIGGNIKNYLPQGEWLADKYGALPGFGKSMVKSAGIQALTGLGRPRNEGGYYPPAQISAGAPIQGSRAAPYMADYNLRTPQFAEGGWISPRPNGDGVITTLGDTPSGEEIVIPADKYLAYMANGGTVGRIPSFAGGKGPGVGGVTTPGREGGWTEDIPFPSKSSLLDLILANTKEREGASKGGGWKDSAWWDLLGYGGIAGQMIWDYYKGKKPAEQAQERAEYSQAYLDEVRPEQTGRREFPTYNRLPTRIEGYELPPLAGGAYIESNRAMPGLVAETARQKGPLMASEYVGSPGAVLRDLGLTRRGVQDVLDTNPMTLQRFANGGEFKAEEPLEYFPSAPDEKLTTSNSTIEEIRRAGGNLTNESPYETNAGDRNLKNLGVDPTTITKPVNNYDPGTVQTKTLDDVKYAFDQKRKGLHDLRSMTTGYQEAVAGQGRLGIRDRAGNLAERAGRDMNQIKKDYWMQIDANRRANQQSASAIDVAQRGAGRDDYMADIYGWNVGDTSDINWAGLGDRAAGNMRMSRFSPGDMAADWVEDRRRGRYVRDQYS
jgi:hypothetical protein